jgi:hypothetical protein
MNLTLQVDQDTIYLRATWERIKLEPSGNKIKLYPAGESRLHPPWRVERRS